MTFRLTKRGYVRGKGLRLPAPSPELLKFSEEWKRIKDLSSLQRAKREWNKSQSEKPIGQWIEERKHK